MENGFLEKTFEKNLPRNIVWREKSPMQDGSGTAVILQVLFNTIVTDKIFSREKKGNFR